MLCRPIMILFRRGRVSIPTIVVGCALIVWFYAYVRYLHPPLYVFINKNMNKTCIIPDLDPFDESVMKYAWHPDPITCDQTPSIFLVDSKGYLVFNSTWMKLNENANLNCTYSIVELVNDFKVKYLPEVIFNVPIYVDSESFIVRCRNREPKLVYENLFFKINHKKIFQTKTVLDETEEHPSVVMFGIDSVSRLAALRKLPKTMDYLKNNLNAYVFKGYTKTGDHSFPNLVGVFTGDTPNNFRIDLDNDHCESLPFIWKNFSNKGYVTMYAEDWPEIATFNQVMRKGFKIPPTDHYLRPFFLAMRKIKPMQYTVNQVLQFIEHEFVKLRKSSSLCYGNIPTHLLIVNYYKQFLKAYKFKRTFSFTWLNEISHNFVNFVELADTDIRNYLQWLNDGNYLEKSIFIFFADHGSRVDNIRNTFIGRVEDRMPVLAISIPKYLKIKYPNIHRNLLSNTRKLTSHYDLFQTLKDILHNSYNKTHSVMKSNKPYSISLFKNIPNDRTCAQARIPDHYCACYSSTQINVTDDKVLDIAEFVVKEINQILIRHKYQNMCSKLYLKKIHSAEIVSSGFERNAEEERFSFQNIFFSPEEEQTVKFLVSIETSPGNAIFEASVNFDFKNNAMRILNDISRINRYGRQGVCMPDRFLRGYCYCKREHLP